MVRGGFWGACGCAVLVQMMGFLELGLHWNPHSAAY